MNLRRWVWLSIFIIAAVFLAPLLQEILLEGIILPLAYLGWWAGLVLRSIAQVIYWAVIILVVGVVTVSSLANGWRFDRREENTAHTKMGPVESLAKDIQLTKKGMYFKWMIANRLAKLSQVILTQSKSNDSAAPQKLNGVDWPPPDEIKAYFENGLQRSIMPSRRNRFFGKKPASPFDVDLNQVVSYLETQQEKTSDKSSS